MPWREIVVVVVVIGNVKVGVEDNDGVEIGVVVGEDADDDCFCC